MLGIDDAVAPGAPITGRLRADAAVRSRVRVVAALDRRVWVDPETQLKLIEGPIPASRR